MQKQKKTGSARAAAKIGVAVGAIMAAMPAEAADDTLRIISFNTWGARSLIPAAVDLYSAGKYDIITIQEYNADYGNDLAAKLPYTVHSYSDTGVASALPMTTGLGGVQKTPYVKLEAEGGRPATIVATEHLNYWDNPLDHRVREAKELNDWARSETAPIILTGDFNAGDISERGLLEVVQQELMMTRARETGNADYKAWTLQYVARNHPIGSEKYKAAEDYINKASDTRPTDLFSDEMYPVLGNTPSTMNILKKDFQILQNPEDKEKFAPHELADGSTTWPSVGEDDEAFKWPSWGRTQIDHFVASRPYAKWWELVDPADDKYVGGVLDQSVSQKPDGTPLSDHEPVAHEIRWTGPRVEESGDGTARLIFDSQASGFDGAGEFKLSRNNNRTDVYLGQLSDANGQPVYQRPEQREPISEDQLAKLVSYTIYDRHDTAPYLEQLKPFIPTDKMDVFNQRLTELLDNSADGYYRTVIENYFQAHRDEYPGIGSISDMSWEQWGYILMDHLKADLTFQRILEDTATPAWEELRATLGLDDPAVRARLSQLTGLDFENDPYAPLKLQLDCLNTQHLSLQGAKDMCVDDHSRFKDIAITDGKTVAIDESEALGSPDGAVILANGGIRTAGPDDDWATWADSVTKIDKAVHLAGLGWIDVSHPSVPVAMLQTISGEGTLEKRGVGTLALMAANSYTGGTIVTAGTLKAGVAGAFVDNTAYAVNGGTLDLGGFDLAMSFLTGTGGTIAIGAGSLTLDQADDTAYAGAINGDGHLAKAGAGKLLLTGDSSAFAGTTDVAAGTLTVNGRLGGIIDVTGGTLGGAGTIGTTRVAAGGTLAPGGSIGTLKVDGGLTFEKGSTYQVEVNPEGADSDLLQVTGTADLLGGSVAHIGANGNYDIRSSYTILSAATLNGAFDGVTSNFAFLTPNLAYDYGQGTVDLQLARNDRQFASAARTRNQIAVANGIESIGFNGASLVYDAIAQLADDDGLIQDSFDQLSGEIHASAGTALINDSRLIRSAVNDRIRAAFRDVAAADIPVMSFGPDTKPLAKGGDKPVMAAWGQAFGAWSETDGDGNAAGLDQSTGGFVTGLDAAVAENWRLGVMAGYSRSSFDVDGLGSGDADNYHVGVYGGGRFDALSIRSGLAYSWHTVETSRSVAFPGFEDRLRADYDAGTFQLFGELGYRIDTSRVAFEPFANLAHVRVKTDGFIEKGGAAALTAESQTTDTTFTTLGLRASAPLTFGSIEAQARGTVGWQHAYGDTTPVSTLAFGTGDAFSVAGVPLAEDTALVEAGLDFRISRRATLGVSYTGQFGSDLKQNAIDAKFTVNF